MTRVEAVQDRIANLRARTLDVLQALSEHANAFEVPGPPDILEASRQKLAANEYRVLVVGEAKRGKSTFVNALVGRPLLPTDVDVATCQVFRIRRAERPAARIRFEDDSAQTIALDDLARYGSQVVADAQGTPRLDQIIRWIEVDVPVQFLPEGINLLDTPGLGSLYAAHGQITQRFVPEADAVIFVLDSEQPILEPEVRFLDRILTITRNVFCIQTKIDLYREEQWQAIRQRNEAILRERFGERLADPRVWPISSTDLLTAGETGDTDYLDVSGHRELAAALQAFLFHAAGWGRAADGLVAADRYHGVGRQTLASRLAGLQEESKRQRAGLQEAAERRRQQFNTDWGPSGHKRRELLEAAQRIAELGRAEMRQALQPGGAIELGQRQRIAEVPSVQAARELAETLPSDVVAETAGAWRRVCQEASRQAGELLAAFWDAAEAQTALAPLVGTSETTLAIPVAQPLAVKDDWWERLKAVRMDAFTAGWLGGFLSFLPGGRFIVMAANVWGAWRSPSLRGGPGDPLTERAKQELMQRLGQHLQQMRAQFFDVHQANGHFGVVDEYFRALARTMAEQVDSLTNQKLREAQAEIERLTEAAKLDDQQRAQRAAQVKQQLADWDALQDRLRQAVAELQSLEQPASQAEPVYA